MWKSKKWKQKFLQHGNFNVFPSSFFFFYSDKSAQKDTHKNIIGGIHCFPKLLKPVPSSLNRKFPLATRHIPTMHYQYQKKKSVKFFTYCKDFRWLYLLPSMKGNCCPFLLPSSLWVCLELCSPLPASRHHHGKHRGTWCSKCILAH